MPLTERQYAERLKAVIKAAEVWKDRLVDVSGRTALRNYRDYKLSTIDLTPGGKNKISIRAIGSLLAGRAVRMTTLFPDEDAQPDALKRLKAIYRRAQENSDEKGIDTLFAAAGLATWEVDTEVKPNTPVILIPLTISPTDAARSEFIIKVSGDPHINPVLEYILQSEHSISVSKENGDIAEDLPGSFTALTDLLKTYAAKWSKRVPGFAIAPRVVVTNFKYTNMAMVNDLADNTGALASNDIVAAIAGVSEAREKLSANISDAPINLPDIATPESEYLILDADSSQHRAINRALDGESLVVWGPPGTGKSQVIANLIAALIAEGKRVLFVAEKRAAIDVVTARLDDVGLSDLVMDAHGGIGSKREFAQKMGASLSGIKKIPEQDYADVHSKLARTRDRLIAHRDNVHNLREQWGISVFEIQSKLIGTPEAARTDLRIHRSKARKLNTQSIERLKESAQKWVELEGHKFSANYPEWYQSKVKTKADARAAFDMVRDIDEILPNVHSQVSAYLDEVGLTPPDTVSEWGALLEWLSNWARTPSNISDDAAVRQALELVCHLSATLPNVHSQVSACLDEVGLTPPDTVSEWGTLLEWLSNWAHTSSNVNDDAAVRQALELVCHLSATLPNVHSQVSAYLDEVGLTPPDTVSEWGALLEWLSNWAHTPSNVNDDAAVRQTLELVCHLSETLPAIHSRISACLGEVGLTPPNTISEWRALLEWLSDVERFSTQFSSGIYELEHEACVAALAPAYRWYAPMASAFSPRYRNALKSVRAAQVDPEIVSAIQAIDALEQAKEHLHKWNGLNHDGSFPRAPSNLKEITAQADSLADDLKRLSDFLPKLDALNQPYADLEQRIQCLTPPNVEVCSQTHIWELERRGEDLRDVITQVVDISRRLQGLADFLPKLDALNQSYADLEQCIQRLTPPNVEVCSQTHIWELERRGEPLRDAITQVSDVSQRLHELANFLPKLDALNQPYADLEQQIQRLVPPNMKVCSQTRIWALERHRANLRDAITQVSDISQRLQRLADFLPKLDALNQPYATLANTLQTMAGQQRAASNLRDIRRLEREFSRDGVTHIVSSAGSETPPEYIDRAIEYSWLNAVLDDLKFQNSELNNFNSATHNRHQREFVESDIQHIGASPKRILRKVAEAATQMMDKFPAEHQLVMRESAKRRRLLPVRDLFRRAPHVITAIRPCWAMSPLLVAETIQADANMFDVVIFDEASQIPPEEAICSLARAPQAIIAGDYLQLPPTNFFNSRESDDEQEENDYGDAELTEGTESILDVARTGLLSVAMLNWHYRSRDARLIAFSNVHIYEGNLTAFPGVAVKAPFTHHLVPFNPSLPLKTTKSHPDEVAKVVDLIIEHARECPDETLGVIAFGIDHANSIEETLRVRIRDMADPSLDKFFSSTVRERFFVKNIETVQGDERDVIILSVGYHKNAKGVLPYRFGPLNQDGGERRLNVAVTRARSRIHLVSSFSHQDMAPGRSKAKGVELLRQYLEFAASGGSELGAAVSDEPLNPFEMDVKQRLEQAGVPVTSQYGAAGYRIDFACAHPEREGEMVLAIEADGASYHSGNTARDRDRLRQEVLENKGWRFHRIWSTDWFRDPEGETRKAVKAWKQAVRDADAADARQPKAADMPEQTSQADADDAAPARSRRPNIITGQSIDKYPLYVLVLLARWILSDTLLRTDEELMAEMRKDLGFKRRGRRVDAALEAAIKIARDNPIDWASKF